MKLLRSVIRHRHGLAWLALAGMAFTAASPWIPRMRWAATTAIRAMMPWAPLSAAPLAAVAAARGHRRLAALSGVVGLAGMAMAAPLVVRRPQPPVDPAAQPLTIVHANLLYINRHVADVPAALARLDADVITFSELTPMHATRLRSSTLAATYPYRIELPERRGSGTGLWSRHPITQQVAAKTKHHTLVADVAAPGGTVRLVVMHTQSPIIHHREWEHDLEQLGGLEVGGPAVMAGDFNAGWWHPEFRRLLERGGWRDAHVTRGRGLSCSWPTERWHPLFHWHPPFTRLDHALVNDGLAVLGVLDFDVPGSDHRGLMVTVQRAAPATP